MLTIHRSKGLEFPIVYLPFLWETGYDPRRKPSPVFFHDPDAGDARTIDVALEGREYDAPPRRSTSSSSAARTCAWPTWRLTRARHQAVVWWAGSFDSRHSPLGRLLFSRDAAGDVAPPALARQATGTCSPGWQRSRNRRAARIAISVERAALGAPAAWSPPPAPLAELGVSAFDRSLDLRWRRTSYSDITAGQPRRRG